MSTLRLRAFSVLAAAALVSSCTLQDVDQPLPLGPSTLALSLAVTASPDILPEDGVSTSLVTIVARDANGQRKPGVSLRVDTVIGSEIVDYGQLSANNVTTNGNGEATVIYVAPLSPRPGTDLGNEVTIAVRQVGVDFGSTVPTAVRIRLVPVFAPREPGAPRANFVFSPTQPKVGQSVQFDGSSSVAEAGRVIVGYRWDFGDTETDSHVKPAHDFANPGTYFVTLTVTDNAGLKASLTRAITVVP